MSGTASLAILAALALVTPANAQPVSEPTFVLKGRVVDAENAPIEGVHVQAQDTAGTHRAEAVSGAQGEFSLPPLPPGSYLLEAKLPGRVVALPAVQLGPDTPPVQIVFPAEPADAEHSTTIRAAPQQTGASVAEITRTQIQAVPGGDSQDLSRIISATQPGLVEDVFGIGPMHFRANQAGILYVIDGVPLPPGLLFQFADTIPTRLVDSIRVFTGGLPAEYADQGGVVDVSTRHSTATPEGGVQMAYGTYQLLEPSAWYARTVGNVGMLVSGTFESTQRGLDPPDVTPILHDQMIAGSAFTREDIRIGSSDRVELIGEFARHNYQIPIDPTILPLSDGPPGAMRGNDSYGNSPPVFVPYNANPTETETDVFAAFSWIHSTFTGRLQVSPYVRYSYGDLLCDPVNTLGPTADPGSTCSNVARTLVHEGANVSYGWNVGEHQSLKAGIVLDDAQTLVDYTQFTRDDASPLGGPNPERTISGGDRTNIQTGGVYVQDELTFGRLKLFPGVRGDLQNAVFVGTNLPNLFMMGPSARLGMSYALTRTLELHAFTGYLWEPPTSLDGPVAARILVPGVAGQPIPVNLKPERDEYAELGLKDRFFKRLSASLTAWGRLSQDQIDVQNVGTTDLVENYNYAAGRATGVEAAVDGFVNRYVSGYANATWEIGQGRGVDSEQYLFTKAELADSGWQILDHVQRWTVNVGVDLHDESGKTHLFTLYQYGSGLRTGPDNDETVPGHSVWNVSLRHRFDFFLKPEVAVDVLNVFNAAYPIRIANGFFDGAWGPLRQINIRLAVPFHG